MHPHSGLVLGLALSLAAVAVGGPTQAVAGAGDQDELAAKARNGEIRLPRARA
jgi:hypothetical protein